MCSSRTLLPDERMGLYTPSLDISISKYRRLELAVDAWDWYVDYRSDDKSPFDIGEQGSRSDSGLDPPEHVLAFRRDVWVVVVQGSTDVELVRSVARQIDSAIIAFGPQAAPEPTVDVSCTVSGTVTGTLGDPLDRILVRVVRDGVELAEGATAADGSYEFADIDVSPTADNARPMLSVEFELLEQLGESFSVSGKNGEPIGIALDPVAPTGAAGECQFDVDSASVPASARPIKGATSLDQWKVGAEIFRYVDEALTFAELEMGADIFPTTQLFVYIECDAATPDAGDDCAADPNNSFYDGPWSGEPVLANSIVLDSDVTTGPMASRRITVYHEVGHFVNNVGFGNQLPIAVAGREPHGGLYKNLTSTDALIEGFADFFAALVRERVGGARPGVYDWNEGPVDIELNRKIWDSFGREEEWAFAGVLHDLIDDSEGYPQRTGPEEIAIFDWVSDLEGETLVVLAQTRNQTDASAFIMYEVELDDGRTERFLTSPIITPPDGWAELDTAAMPHRGASVRTVRARSIQGVDDDSVTLPLRQVWALFAAEPAAETVADFYLTLTFELDEATMARVDEIFIAHGFFNDVAGGVSNREHDDGEAVGLSGYRNIGGQDRPDRFEPVPQGVTEIPFAVSGPAAANAVAEVEVIMAPPREHLSYRYSVAPNADGNVHVTVPAADVDATVRVTARGEGVNPTWLTDIDPGEFWAAAADADTAPISLSGEVTAATGSTGSTGGSGGGGDGGGGGTVGSSGSGGFGVGPALAAVLVIAALGGGLLWTRRRSLTSAPPAAAPPPTHVPPVASSMPPDEQIDATPPAQEAWWATGSEATPTDPPPEQPPPQPTEWWNDEPL